VSYSIIGHIYSPYKDIKGVPIQPTGAKGVRGTVEIDEEYRDGLKDLEGFSHIMLLYHFHLSNGPLLTVRPFLDDTPRGIFATRAPRRPNPIGLSIVRLVKVEGTTLYIKNVDIIDGTPLIDIKPYVPDFDHWDVEKTGWLSSRAGGVCEQKADDRFK
jgi:tRNA-Thr(GGU) m(6)t(6)A37 methyltransferase TsaA